MNKQESQNLMIGSWVLAERKPRQVHSLTTKKAGFKRGTNGQRETCLFFVKSETEAGTLTADDITRLRKEYYAKPDPDPCIDPETGQPYELTEDERLEWEIYMLKKQGNYAKANKLFNERNGVAVAAEALPAKQQAKTGEVKDEELPF